MKLISMTDFVLNNPTNFGMEVQSLTHQNSNRYLSIFRYATFLKQPLELWMFVTCDDDGKVLEVPHGYNLWIAGIVSDMPEYLEYQQAKGRCLFKGFKINEMQGFSVLYFPSGYCKDFYIFKDAFKNWSIEDLVEENLQLTETAIKQIGL